jgi:phosphoglycolate phosphatase-like HAD superfamily hydrolase
MEQIKAVLFDVIGTTVLENDPDLINSCFQAAFSGSAVAVTKVELQAVRGMDKLEAIKQILKTTASPPELALKILDDFKLKVAAEISNFREHPVLGEVMALLRSRDIVVGVGSGLPSALFEMIYKHLRWQRHGFGYEEVFEKFRVGRPDPAMINDMCQRTSIRAGHLLKVGDTVSDIMEGKNAGAQTAAVLIGTQPREKLIACNPDYILQSLEEIITIINKQPFKRA